MIGPTDGSLQAIDFSPLSSNQMTSYPVFWAPNGEKLVLYVREQVPQQDGESFEDQYRYLVYTPSTATFDEIALTGIAVGMGPVESEALIFRSEGAGGFSLGWLNLDTGEFQEESAVDEVSEGPYALSPNYKILLQGDSSDYVRCRNINSLSIGSDSGFQPLISLGCYPAWSHDGSKLAYAAKGDLDYAPNRLLIANADGSGLVSIFGEELIADLAYPTWSPQGSSIAFTKGGPSGSNAIYLTELPSGIEY
ncbi:MAG: TolB family protein [Anaerolineales bacterium]